MKILHLVLSCFYKENFGYQENLLPKAHKLMGYETSIVTYDGHSNILTIPNTTDHKISYTNSDGIEVTVLPRNHSLLSRLNLPVIKGYLNKTRGLLFHLNEAKPDIIFCHGIFTPDYREVIKYKRKHPECKIFIDNHADYYNSPVRNRLDRVIYRTFFSIPIVNSLASLSEKVWGVTPWRVIYANKVYKIPREKIDLLIMGGDDTLIDFENQDKIRKEIRQQYNIPDDAFLIVTGGKFDITKNLQLLANVVFNLQKSHKNLYLVAFGSVDKDVQELCSKYLSDQIQFIGWIDSKLSYNYFLASDLVCFAGTHSVLWEQACACGIPCLFRDWNNGVHHLDVGGNCHILKSVTYEILYREIEDLLINKDNIYSNMKKIARGKGAEYFSYRAIAKKSIIL